MVHASSPPSRNIPTGLRLRLRVEKPYLHQL
jgi:hypothetical protein